ncbi:ABC transporter permease [Fibrobacter sp.]|uniref:MlaE family ABC transporter permease n=1 Tax=Fibrobacter sp. TaxID=35828 RepID=UPI0025BB0CAC|nr:ABC transporter permease [Fibrobacter sp.]MBR3072023.1 ABC transporter permease [Fibrobacter sp.]
MQDQQLKNWQKMTPIGRVFHSIGLFILKRRIGQLITLFLRSIASIFASNHNFKTDSRNIILQTFFTGIEIFPPLFTVATLFGTVTIIEVISLMGKMGMSDFVGNLLVVTIIRELGPIITAFLIAGRTGSSLTTYIGGMVINSEVDALATMGINPIRYLVMPSVIGGSIATVIMYIIFSSSAIGFGFLVTKGIIFITGNAPNVQITWHYLSTEILKALTVPDFIFAIIKPLIFGIIITTNACYQALNIQRDIRQVPKATSRSVISSFLYVVLADVALSAFYFIGYMQNLSTMI